ncbi:MAG: hypothetical protein A2029_10685 [Chloroflexi bacterium RBG_19FT_COMBO_47_9]|nr:MAG: hypothetical protein A2029_10685 [Chloroflexi bacterium RBG_19FT_COMBO_47_9]
MEMTAVGQLGTFSVILSDSMMIIYASEACHQSSSPRRPAPKSYPQPGFGRYLLIFNSNYKGWYTTPA